MIRTSLTAASVAILSLSMMSAPASAATSRIMYYGATERCEAVDPANFTGLRYRNVGVYNASNASIQIACTLPAEFVADVGATDIWIRLHNFKNAATNVNCTVFAGSRATGTNSYPTTGSIDPLVSTWRTFSSVDRVDGSYTHYALACVLPPGVELSMIRVSETDAGDGL
ncbi:hypothetical protein [Arenimonas aestuarii]